MQLPALGADTAVRYLDPTLLAMPAKAASNSSLVLAAACGVALLVGAFLGIAIQRLLDNREKSKNRPRWPRDWPPFRSLFTRDPNPTKPGYMALDAKYAMGSGHMPLGRTYPRLSLFPDKYPFRELRRMVQFATSRPVWVPYQKRFQHTFILGATGKGKSTAYAVPFLSYGALERERKKLDKGKEVVEFPGTAYFAIDVKSPQFVRMFARLYRDAGKDVVFFDPFSPTETLGFEPLWRADEGRRAMLGEVINNYTTEPGPVQESGNSEFFKMSALRVLRAVLDVAQYWPRRYCNLPCVAQLILAGDKAIAEMFEKASALLPDLPVTVTAIEKVLPSTVEELRTRERPGSSDDPQDPRFLLDQALGVLDRSGYPMAFLVKRMRRYEAEYAAGKHTAEQIAEIRRQFWANVKAEWIERRKQLDKTLATVQEFIRQPEETRSSTVSTVTGKVAWWKDPDLARAFSVDEVDVRTLVERPCLFLVGAPMAKLDVGSLFVSSILTNMALNAVFQRGMLIEKNAKGVRKHGIFFLLDEFPALAVKKAPTIVATFRGYLSGLIMIFQELGQLRQLYGDNSTTMQANSVHKVLLQGSHEDTAEFYASKTIGDVAIKKRSESGLTGEKKNISTSVENVPLMTTRDVRDMRLNGEQKPGMALSVGSDVPPFPLLPIPFYDDPVLRKLLRLKRSVSKTGFEGRPTWKFWEWGERWNPTAEGAEYLVRRRSLSPAERAAGAADPVWERQQDPYTQFLDYLLGDAKGAFDELVEPRLALSHIGVVDNDFLGQATAAANGKPAAGPPGAAQRAAGGAPQPIVPPALLVPVYGTDARTLVSRDFTPLDAVDDHRVVGGGLADRVAAIDALADAEPDDPELEDLEDEDEDSGIEDDRDDSPTEEERYG